jgi:RNA polymerase-binding protein DksA
MSLTSEQIAHFQERLLKEKARLTEELKSLGHKDKEGHFETTYPETGGNSEDDNSMEMTELVDNEAIVGRLESDLRDVEKALKAIENGTYGVCKYTGKDIDLRRLEARPTSLSSIEAKKALTQEL